MKSNEPSFIAQMWDSTVLRGMYDFYPGQMDDGRSCTGSVAWALCKYDPNTCKNNVIWKSFVSLFFSNYFSKMG